MSELTTWMYIDSRATRIATIIAMIYLPANIVLVSPVPGFSPVRKYCQAGVSLLTCSQAFFSSVFVEIVRPPGHSLDRGSGDLVVHQQLWMGVVSTLVLVGATFATFWVWKRPEGRPGRASC
jgi:hypothetical protein